MPNDRPPKWLTLKHALRVLREVHAPASEDDLSSTLHSGHVRVKATVAEERFAGPVEERLQAAGSIRLDLWANTIAIIEAGADRGEKRRPQGRVYNANFGEWCDAILTGIGVDEATLRKYVADYLAPPRPGDDGCTIREILPKESTLATAAAAGDTAPAPRRRWKQRPRYHGDDALVEEGVRLVQASKAGSALEAAQAVADRATGQSRAANIDRLRKAIGRKLNQIPTKKTP